MVHEQYRLTNGQLANGNDIIFNYKLLRECENSRKEAAIKAIIARVSVPVDLDPERSWSSAVWELMRNRIPWYVRRN